MPPKKDPLPKRMLQLRIHILMAEQNIRSVAELHRRLISEGVEISHPQLWRVVENRANTLSIPLLNALLNLFNCEVDKLFEAKPEK